MSSGERALLTHMRPGQKQPPLPWRATLPPAQHMVHLALRLLMGLRCPSFSAGPSRVGASSSPVHVL